MQRLNDYYKRNFKVGGTELDHPYGLQKILLCRCFPQARCCA